MKFKLKTIFGVTLLSALVVGSITNDQATLKKVRAIKASVDTVVAEIEAEPDMQVARSEHRFDFVLFSVGKLRWDIEREDQADVSVELTWQSRLLFPQRPSIELISSEAERESDLVQNLAAVLRTELSDTPIEIAGNAQNDICDCTKEDYDW